MKKQRAFIRPAAVLTAAALCLALAGCSAPASASSSGSVQGGEEEHLLTLSDSAVTLDGAELSQEGEEGAVTLSHDIVYYQSGQGADYGEGTQADEHSAEEAAAHTVVTIRQAGTYRVSGSLSAGQLAVDLGSEAREDPEAVVTLILDGVDLTCTVAPAVIFYNVYECDTAWVAYDQEESQEYQPSAQADTSAAGANVVLADGSVNNITGSYVARIYKEGTTKKLHKYDGAFYSKMSMNVSGEAEGTGVLNIQADNEGLDSELHLTIHGGTINIQAQNDGINTNEDGVSVTTINGGTLQISAGLGAEGDGIDSNGYLVINGGNVYTMANERSGDGGLDADGDILLNGGYVVALGTRNDAASQNSAQQYMELSFASTLPQGSQILLSDPEGGELLSFTLERACQSLTFSSPDLQQGVDYTLTVDGVVQEYTGHQSGGFGGAPGGMGGPGGDRTNLMEVPDGLESWLDTAQDVPDDVRTWLEGLLEQQNSRPERPEGDGMPQEPGQEGGEPFQGQGGRTPQGEQPAEAGGAEEASTAFTLSGDTHSFSGVTDSARDSGRTAVSFTADLSVGEDGTVTLSGIQADQPVDSGHVQLTITDVPSEDYAASCLLSDGEEALAAILPGEPGTYRLTIAVTGDGTYAGSSQFTFTIPG